jgi:hypothetical protein
MADKGGDRAPPSRSRITCSTRTRSGSSPPNTRPDCRGSRRGVPRPGAARTGERGLLERIDWIADCIEPHLAPDFPTMADQIEAAMPPPLDPTLTDDDFGSSSTPFPACWPCGTG